ncbi:MAG: NAD-dependent epimerase/dehydratase family protein [Candidatus Hydrothermarchaeales archaeon]
MLVTGCAGFIGSSVVDELLKSGYSVVGVDAFRDYYSRGLKEKNIEKAAGDSNFSFIDGDILDVDLPSVDYVVHEAAQAGVRASWGKGFDIYARDNVLVTQRLLEFYKGSDIRMFVYASSSSVYGDSKLPMREDGRLRPVSPYGVTKLAGENLCYLYYKNYDLPTVSLRYFTVYGPRQRPDMAINKFTRSILDGEEIVVFGDGKQTRDFTYVSDVVNATINAMKSNEAGEVFNIGGGSRISVNDLISLLGEALGKDPKVCYGDKQRGDVLDTYADISKAEHINWRPKITLKEGIGNYVDWIRNNF